MLGSVETKPGTILHELWVTLAKVGVVELKPRRHSLSMNHLSIIPAIADTKKRLITPLDMNISVANPFWFRLCRSWCLRGHTGLTIPFIVGAESRSRNTSAHDDDVRRLLGEIAAYDSSDGPVAIRWCSHRCAFVIGVLPFGRGRLKIDSSLMDGDMTEAKLLEQIARMAEASVRAGDFSRLGIPPIWVPFEDHEIKFIDLVIAR